MARTRLARFSRSNAQVVLGSSSDKGNDKDKISTLRQIWGRDVERERGRRERGHRTGPRIVRFCPLPTAHCPLPKSWQFTTSFSCSILQITSSLVSLLYRVITWVATVVVVDVIEVIESSSKSNSSRRRRQEYLERLGVHLACIASV